MALQKISRSLLNTGVADSSDATAITIDSSERVGIGTASPVALLHINGSGDAVRVTSTNTGSGGAQVDLLQYTTSPADNDIHGMINFGGYTSGTSSAYGSSIRSVWSDVSAKEGQLQFFTRDDSDFAARMIIDKDGNVGIGTDAPGHKLDVTGTIRAYASGSGNAWLYTQNDNKTYLTGVRGSSSNAYSIYDITADKSRFRVNSDGGIAIGEDNVGYAGQILSIKAGSGNTVLYGESTDADCHISLRDNSSSTNVTYGCEGNNHAFGNDGSIKWIMDASNGYLIGQSASQVRIVLGSTGSSNNNTSNWVRGTGNELGLNSAGGNIGFEINGTEKLRVQAGGGISFNGDTASANALDDYEEGTWTPTLSGATLSTANGTYTKIGNQVTVHYHLVTTGGLPSSGTQVQVGGLPFTSASNMVGAGSIYARYYSPNDSTLTGIIFNSESVIKLINVNEQSFDYTLMGELEGGGANNAIYAIGTMTYQV